MSTPSTSLTTSRRRAASIQLRLLVLVAAAALPALIFSIVQMRAAHQTEETNARLLSLQLARRVASRVNDHVSLVDATLITLSRAVRTDAAARSHNDTLLASVGRELGPRFLALSVADTLGHVIGLSVPGPTNYTVADRKYFRDALRSPALAVGEPMVGRVSGRHAVALSRQIVGTDGRARGVVSASTTLDELGAIVSGGDLPAHAVVTVVDEQGFVLVQTKDAEQWVGRNVGALTPVRKARREREGTYEIAWIDGAARLSGFTMASHVPWQVVVGIPRDVALHDAEMAARGALWLGLASLAIGIGLAWLLANRIAGPIRTLTADAELFGRGDLTHRSSVQVAGELGRLAATFNRMAETLQRREEDLAASERRYRILFDTMPLPMWVYDVETLRFLAVNETAVIRYGYTREEFLSMTITEIRPAGDAPRLSEYAKRTAERRLESSGWRHRTKSGEVIDVEISSQELADDVHRRRIVVVNDVTQRRRTEIALRASQEQLRQSQKMEAVGSLAGGIAHDFNNLLTAILGYCDLALDSLEKDHAVREDVEEIRSAAQRAAELTHQLLAFSRQQVLNPRVFSLNDAVERTQRMIRRLISENITVEHSLAVTGALVSADATQVEQIIVNLAVNARDAMPRGGVLTILTGTRRFDAPHPVAGATLPAGTYSTLSVNDTGAGIPDDIRERLFEPFFTTKSRGQGTGLGLATVYGVARQSGGGIEVESAPGVGTRLTVYFPWTDAAADVAPEPMRRDATARGEGTILLAEDDDAVRAIAKATLERAGYRVLAARDGPGALLIAEAHDGPIDLLLTDVIMPGMNGRELAERLTATRHDMAVLFASGYTGNVLADLGLSLPGVRLLDKPFTPAILTAMVASVLDEARQPEPQ